MIGDDDGDKSLSCEPSETEIRLAIKQLKNGKAPGVDMITAEVAKAWGGNSSAVAGHGQVSCQHMAVRGSAGGLGEVTDHPTAQEGSS